MLTLCPGKHQHQLSPLGGGGLGYGGSGSGRPSASSPSMWCGAERWGWGARSGQHQGVQHRIGTASLDTGVEVLRASVVSHALWVLGWRPGPEQGQS